MKCSISGIVAWSGLLLFGCAPPPTIAPPGPAAPPPIDLVSSAGVESATFAVG